MKYPIKISLLSLGIAVLTGPSQAASVKFDFDNGTAFDNGGAGATMSASGGGATIVVTTVDILAPEYDANDVLTGNTLSALGMDGVKTNITVSTSAIGVNHPSYSNAGYQTAFGPSDEASSFNLNEGWVIEFDTSVTFAEINFSSIDDNEQFDVTIEGVIGTFSFTNITGLDDYSDPFNGLEIPAGADITFFATGNQDTVSVRITEFTVETIPEPSGVLLTLLGSVLFTLRRKR